MRRLLPLAAILAFTTCTTAPAFSADDKDRVICFSLGNENYKDANKFYPGLNACTRMINSGRFQDKALAAIYRALLDEIERDGFRVLDRRLSLTPLRKAWLAWKTSWNY